MPHAETLGRNASLRLRASARERLRVAAGGGERDRTDDLLLAKQALSQLSYTPLPGQMQRSAIRTR